MTPQELAKKLYSMELGEVCIDGDSGYWIRVPGGWVCNSAFIPYAEEFKQKPVPTVDDCGVKDEGVRCRMITCVSCATKQKPKQ